MSRYVFGFVMYGIGDPYNSEATAPVLYTDGVLPTTGLPTELSGATIRTLVTKRPGVNWGADPRHPVGSEESATITLLDDAIGTLGTLFLDDPSAPYWGLETNRLSASATAVGVVGETSIGDGITYYLNNEAVNVAIGAPTWMGTQTLALTRGVCGSTARVHALRPSAFSEGEDGSEDRILLRKKPDWEAGFLCGVYLFRLDQFGAIQDYVLRRGVVTGEPTPRRWPEYDISIKFLEDRLNSHTIGETSKEVTLTQYILVHRLEGAQRPSQVSFLLTRPQAERFFNEPLGSRSSLAFSSTSISNLNTRLKADASVTYEIKLSNDYEWVYKITALSLYTFTAAGVSYQSLKVSCSLQPGGYSTGATAVVTSPSTKLAPWYQNAIPAGVFGTTLSSGGYQGYTPPRISLRLKLRKTVVQAFLLLSISDDGSSGGTYDKLIGGIGAGLPASWFSTGSVGPSALGVATNTTELLQLNQLFSNKNTYYFDLTTGISLKDFLTNEFIASQLLLGSLQSGLLTLRSWVHEVAATVTLNPINEVVSPGERLAPVKRLDLEAGTNVLTLEPLYRRSVRWAGTQRIKDEQAQKIRFWRDGLQLTPTDMTGTLGDLIRGFYKIFGGAPRVYEVPISMDQFFDDGIEFADAVAWSNAAIPTPTGLGIDAEFFIIGTDLDFDQGRVMVKLIENTLLVAPAAQSTGNIAPTLTVTGVTPVSSTVVDVTVSYVGGAALDLATDFGGLFPDIEGVPSVLRIDRYTQAPRREAERVGSVEAYATIEITGASSLRLTVDAAYLRGDYASAADLITADTTRLNLPGRVTADATLTAATIEPTSLVGAAQQNFISLQPAKTVAATTYTFKS